MLETQAKVQVLLASYNGQDHIEMQLESILNQLDVDISVVISDDCSTDRTPSILAATANQNYQVSLLPAIKCGSAAKNFFRLIRDSDFSSVDFIALSDQDDVWYQSKLARAVSYIEQNEVDAYSSNVTAFWENGKRILINKAQPQQRWDYMFESAGPGCTFVINKRLALALQSFLIEHQNDCNAVALHDWFIYAFARSRGFNWFIDNEPHMLYRQHAANVVGANVGIKASLARWTKLRDGWLIDQALLIANTLGYKDSWPAVKLKRYLFLDRLALIANVNKLRRRMRDRFVLALYLLLPLKR